MLYDRLYRLRVDPRNGGVVVYDKITVMPAINQIKHAIDLVLKIG